MESSTSNPIGDFGYYGPTKPSNPPPSSEDGINRSRKLYLGNYVRVYSDCQDNAKMDVGFSKITNVAAATESTDVAPWGQIVDYIAFANLPLIQQIAGLQESLNNLNNFFFRNQIPPINEENPSVTYNTNS